MEHLYDYLIIGADMTADAATAIRKADAEPASAWSATKGRRLTSVRR
jgi:hypothetical protein